MGSYGQLGYGNTEHVGDDAGELPSTVGFLDLDAGVISIAAGDEHTCALLATGEVWCWGNGQTGRLGYGSADTIGDNETLGDAGVVSVGGAVVQIVAGVNHTCALLATGKVRCWGSSGAGQLGYGNVESIGDSAGEFPATAGDVDAGGDAIWLAVGSERTCALLATGAARCWGNGFLGQLGYGSQSYILLPGGDVNVGGAVVRLAVGEDQTCALLATGTVRCWGRGQDGALGYGSTANVGDTPTNLPSNAGDVPVW
jgi:alpha-tubulin suppressor-like RCC1 family protein